MLLMAAFALPALIVRELSPESLPLPPFALACTTAALIIMAFDRIIALHLRIPVSEVVRQPWLLSRFVLITTAAAMALALILVALNVT